VAAVNPRTVVVVIGGGTVVVDPWDADVAAVLLAWYPGMAGGHAIADILLGDEEPGGRLPFAVPRRAADLPGLDWDATAVRYGRWWGQRSLDRDGTAAAYPFGFGLGYTTFTLGDLTLGPLDGERFDAAVSVTNTGSRAGRHVVQIYALRPADTGRMVRHLVGFGCTAVEPGHTERVLIKCSTRPLQRWDGARLVLEGEELTIEAGSYSGDPLAVSGVLTVSR
jgi:beta-glucosidase